MKTPHNIERWEEEESTREKEKERKKNATHVFTDIRTVVVVVS